MTVESHLGDVIGMPVAPLRPYPMPRKRRWVECIVEIAIVGLSVSILGALLVVWVVIWFLMFSSTAVFSAELYRIPDACTALAAKYGVHDNLTRQEAKNVVAQLDDHMWWPGVRQCRKAVKDQWKL